ncbi:MAG: HPr-rel-A system PqqD family peptide chaperone [Nitrosomonas sp.]|nr:HPr-rel-A system PqqD family peptide chaperone [Nitrosomonas sp.]
MEKCWKTLDYQSLIIEEWDSGFTVFQPDSGSTHYLNKMSVLILKYLENDSLAPLSTVRICNYLVTEFQLQPDTAFSKQVNKTLYRFDELGLVKQIP